MSETCTICGKGVSDKEAEKWHWGEETAHMECILEETDLLCADCGYMTTTEDGAECPECAGVLDTLTEKDKGYIRDEEAKRISDGDQSCS